MSKRDDLLSAARRASEVSGEFEVRKRIDAGYTRVDPEQIAAQDNVLVMYRPLNRLLGGFLREGDVAGVIVNVDRPRGLVHMTCAHELGHYFLGHESTADETVDHGATAKLKELQANQFAYALLAPQWLVVRVMRQKHWTRSSLQQPSVIYQMSLRLGMSYTAMVWSLAGLSVLSQGEAASLSRVQPRSIKQELLDGRTPDDSNRDVWLLDPSDRDHILEPAVGDQFVVDLPNHAGSGYLWSVDDARSEGFTLKPFVRDARVAPRPVERSVPIGGKPTMRYVLTPLSLDAAAGSLEPAEVQARRRALSMHETMPWDASSSVSAELNLVTEFERLDAGFSRAERDLRLSNAREVE